MNLVALYISKLFIFENCYCLRNFYYINSFSSKVNNYDLHLLKLYKNFGHSEKS